MRRVFQGRFEEWCVFSLQYPADQCGKIEFGDEVIQVNYQTVVSFSFVYLIKIVSTDGMYLVT